MNALGSLFYLLWMLAVPLAVIFAVIVLLNKAHGKGTQPGATAFEKLGTALGIEARGGEPYFPNTPLLSFIRRAVHLEGNLAGFQVHIRKYTSGSGKNQTSYTESIVTFHKPISCRFTLSLESVFTRLGKTLGMRDIPTGDTAFDERFLLKGNQPEKVRLAIFPEIRARLLTWQTENRAKGSFESREKSIRYFEQGEIRGPADALRFEGATRILVELAEILEVLEGMDV